MVTYVTGAAIGLNELDGFIFDINAPYTGCLICGEVFQSVLDRTLTKDTTKHDVRTIEHLRSKAAYRRKAWSLEHAKTHSAAEHYNLSLSGEFCTPEAALKLTPLGIFSLDHKQNAASNELAAAMLEAPRAPQNSVQGAD